MLVFVMKNTTPTVKVNFCTFSSKAYKRFALSIKTIKAKVAKGAYLTHYKQENFVSLNEEAKDGSRKTWFLKVTPELLEIEHRKSSSS